jgi:hypothetical protein
VAEKARGNYLDLLDRIHRAVLPRGYLEIGVRDGASLALALPGTRAVAIDPEPVIDKKYARHTQVFPTTSDDYFANRNLLSDLGSPCDLAFVDGMHRFEFALRDFMNIERYAHAGTVVLVHDCYPVNEQTAALQPTTALWSGDVWKLIVCLKDTRPILRVSVVDVPPTGLAIITGLDPTSTVLTDGYAQLTEQYAGLPYSTLSDKASVLNRVENDWSKIFPLLKGPYRHGERRLVFQRAMRAPVGTAKRGALRSLARARRLAHRESNPERADEGR